MSEKDRGQEILQRKQSSLRFMEQNYYDEWEQVWKSYKANRDPEKDLDGNDDDTQTSFGMPMTWATTRRTVARTTAQIPNLKFVSRDPADSEIIGRTLMYQWDKGGVQRQQKKHVLQAALFGWSVRAWYWSVDEYTRTKRVDPFREDLDEEGARQIAETYGIPAAMLEDKNQAAQVFAALLSRYGRGGLLPIRYPYVEYRGPRCDFLFVGDCYPEPAFESIQNSKWFIVERRRNRQFLEAIAKRYPEELGPGVQALLDKFPNGTPKPYGQRESNTLRSRMLSAIGQSDLEGINTEDTNLWTISEQHAPGHEAQLSYMAEQGDFLGEIPYPYDLGGRIAFTELVLIDDLLAGVGDSTARIIRGIQALHDRQACRRSDLVDAIARPLIGTRDRELFENPNMIKRGKGFRLVYMRGAGDMWVQPEMAAIAAAQASLGEEANLMRLFQLAAGENNMSSMANVDPGQNRTATGAKLMAYNQDVLVKDMVDMFNVSSLRADAEMMFALNRSEMDDALEFEGSKYNRRYTSEKSDKVREQWIKAEPRHFQIDGEIECEVGSTLADDDEARVVKATNLFQASMARPDLFNQQKARDEYLTAMGKGSELAQWAAPPAPPPGPEVRTSLSISVKWEEIPAEVQVLLLQKSGIVDAQQVPPPGVPGGPGQMPGPPAPGQPMQGPVPQAPSPEQPQVDGISAFEAATGPSPV